MKFALSFCVALGAALVVNAQAPEPEMPSLFTGIVPKYSAVSPLNPDDPSVPIRASFRKIDVAVTTAQTYTFAPSRAAWRLKYLSEEIAANPKNAKALADRARVWDALTEVFLDEKKEARQPAEAQQYGFQRSARIYDGVRKDYFTKSGNFDPFEALRERDLRAAFALAPKSLATFDAIVQVRSVLDYGPMEWGGDARRMETAQDLLGELVKLGHPEAPAALALMAAKTSVAYSSRSSRLAETKLNAFNALAVPLLDGATPTPLDGTEATSLTELAMWRLAVLDSVLMIAAPGPQKTTLQTTNDADLARAAERFPSQFSSVAYQVWRATHAANSDLGKKWLTLALAAEPPRYRNLPKWRIARALELSVFSDERFTLLAANVFELPPDNPDVVASALEVFQGAKKRGQSALARRALMLALYEGAPFSHWADLAQLDYEAGDWKSAYLSNQIAMQVHQRESKAYDIELDRSPAGELSRWLKFRNAVLLALLEKHRPLDLVKYAPTSKKGSDGNFITPPAVPQSEALYAALREFRFGTRGSNNAVLQAGVAEIERHLKTHPANQPLKLARERLLWAITHQQ